jgi:mono/diheme cytochrome c family protein
MRAIAAAAAALLACSAAAQDGAELFNAHGCAACHRVGLRGGSSGPDLTLAGFRRSKEWLDRWLASPRGWKPGTLMPEQGLSEGDRRALVEYLAAQTGAEWKSAKPWDGLAGIELGRTIYLRAGCVACHGTAGVGGQPNPRARGGVIAALAPLISTYTRDELRAKIRNGAVPESVAATGPLSVMPAWGRVLASNEIDALADYLLTLSSRQPGGDW